MGGDEFEAVNVGAKKRCYLKVAAVMMKICSFDYGLEWFVFFLSDDSLDLDVDLDLDLDFRWWRLRNGEKIIMTL